MKTIETAILANGCFWCADAVFRQVKGIKSVISGYTGGQVKNPDYRDVVEEKTGHAEAVKITFNPEIISYHDILLIFFTTHDPTSLNKQGYDVGTHYRSVIFYESKEQKSVAENLINTLNKTTYDGKIVTEIQKARDFYEAESIHQDFYQQHPEVLYCDLIINPKINRLRHYYADKLK